MEKRLIWVLIAVAFVFGSAGLVVGAKMMDDTEVKLIALFSEDVKEVRQGKLAGAMVAMADNKTLSEAWEEVCSDVIRLTANVKEGK